MLFIVEGKQSDNERKISLTPEEARLLAADLIQCAEEAEDHGTYDLYVKNLSHRWADKDLVLRVNNETDLG